MELNALYVGGCVIPKVFSEIPVYREVFKQRRTKFVRGYSHCGSLLGSLKKISKFLPLHNKIQCHNCLYHMVITMCIHTSQAYLCM